MTKKILSIAPSFNCNLSCKDCYLTTDVTKDMKEATMKEAYFLRAIDIAVEKGYTDFAITWNPYPGAYEMTKKYVRYAKKQGLNTSVTTVLSAVLGHMEDDFLKDLDVLTISVDDMRFKSISQFALRVLETTWDREFHDLSVNFNLLWTPKVFEWLYFDTANFKAALDSISYPDTVQHLIYKPLSIYESEEWFWTNYRKVFLEYPWVNIAGDGTKFIGDIALNNFFGTNNCPGQDFQMIDIDPMGLVRRCPENPIAYDGRTTYALSQYLEQGTDCQNEKCNCITS
jgi:MoaA/NifB/PqqE/SkfB family radical SAM enzyme